MEFVLKGVIHKIYDTQHISDKFSKREFVLAVMSKNLDRTEYVKMDMTGARAEKLNEFGVGDTVEASFNIKGNEYSKNGENMYFTSLNCWMIRLVSPATRNYVATPEAATTTKDAGVVYNNKATKEEEAKHIEAQMRELQAKLERSKQTELVHDDMPF